LISFFGSKAYILILDVLTLYVEPHRYLWNHYCTFWLCF